MDFACLRAARQSLIEEGYCLIDDAMPEADIVCLRGWSDDWLGAHGASEEVEVSGFGREDQRHALPL